MADLRIVADITGIPTRPPDSLPRTVPWRFSAFYRQIRLEYLHRLIPFEFKGAEIHNGMCIAYPLTGYGELYFPSGLTSPILFKRCSRGIR